MAELKGTGVAIITPFTKSKSVDFDALGKLIEFLINGGVDYIVTLGTTGETPVLKKEEKRDVINYTVEKISDRVPVVVGIGGNDTSAVVDEINQLPIDAAVAILSASPYYNKPSQEGIYQHFKAVAAASPIPVILYNVPGRTASNMLPSTVNRIANDFKNVIGIKEAAGDIVQAMKLIQNKPEGFLVISGDDMITLPMVLAGGAGVISVIGEGYPKEFSEMVRLGLQRKVDDAYKLHYLLADSIDMIFEQGNPAGVKEIFKSLNLAENIVRLPLVNVDDNLASRLDKFTKKLS